MLCGELVACSKSCLVAVGRAGTKPGHSHHRALVQLLEPVSEIHPEIWDAHHLHHHKHCSRCFELCLFWRGSGCSFCTSSLWGDHCERSAWSPGGCPLQVWGSTLKCPEIFTTQGTCQTLMWQLDHRGLVVCPFNTRREDSDSISPECRGRELGEDDCNFLDWTVARALGLTLLIVGKAS